MIENSEYDDDFDGFISLLRHLTLEERTDKNIYRQKCIEAVTENGWDLQNVNELLFNDTAAYREICLIAVKGHGGSIQFVQGAILLDEKAYSEICLEAVKQYGLVVTFVKLQYVSAESYREICLEAVKQDTTSFIFVQKAKLDISVYLEIYYDALQYDPYFLYRLRNSTHNWINHEIITDICIGLHALSLPSYVLLNIIDFVLEKNTLTHYKKIDQIIYINEYYRKNNTDQLSKKAR